MNITVGEIVALNTSGDIREAKVRVRAACMTVPLLAGLDVKCGDQILIESGIGIAKITGSSGSKSLQEKES
jgi:hydrogenase maturation factor